MVEENIYIENKYFNLCKYKTKIEELEKEKDKIIEQKLSSEHALLGQLEKLTKENEKIRTCLMDKLHNNARLQKENAELKNGILP